MLVYRVSRSQYADDLNGTGAKLFGGRWNQVDVGCVYTSESRALATLEYAVNVSMDLIPRALSICIFEIDETKIKEIKIKQLPGDWRDVPAPYSTQEFGSQLLQKGFPIIKIPSIVIPDEFNFLLNPNAKERAYKLIDKKDYIFDLRIKSV